MIPFSINGKVAGVLDIDSPSISRFNETDEEGLTHFMSEVEKLLNSRERHKLAHSVVFPWHVTIIREYFS